MDIEAWKRKLECGVPEEWCPAVECDACGSSFEVRVIRIGDVFYTVCIHCLAVKFGIAW